MLVDKMMSGLQLMANVTGMKHFCYGANDLVSGRYKQGTKNLAEGSVRLSLSFLAWKIITSESPKRLEQRESKKIVALYESPLGVGKVFCRMINVYDDQLHKNYYPKPVCIKEFFELSKETFSILTKKVESDDMEILVKKIKGYCEELEIGIPYDYPRTARNKEFEFRINCIKDVLNNTELFLRLVQTSA